jgi:dihydroorotase
VHTSSIKEPISIDMPNAMSKLLHLGMPLVEVVRASTQTPARLIGWEDRIGSLEVGREADVAVLALEEGSFPLTDSYRKAENAKKRLVARETVRAGRRLVA